jgi:hypothetical protein
MGDFPSPTITPSHHHVAAFSHHGHAGASAHVSSSAKHINNPFPSWAWAGSPSPHPSFINNDGGLSQLCLPHSEFQVPKTGPRI